MIKLPLSKQQAHDLETAINEYSFPPIYYDFAKKEEIRCKNMQELEIAIRQMIFMSDLEHIKYGLANVIYWGNANAGYQMYRVKCFMDNFSYEQVARFKDLINNRKIPTLQDIKRIRMPQFSGISFISKVTAFLDPVNYCVLDLSLSELRHDNNKSLNRLVVYANIPVTTNNSEVYYQWCNECLSISSKYYKNKYRAVDIERGFFFLVQNHRLEDASQIYNDA